MSNERTQKEQMAQHMSWATRTMRLFGRIRQLAYAGEADAVDDILSRTEHALDEWNDAIGAGDMTVCQAYENAYRLGNRRQGLLPSGIRRQAD